MADTQGRRKHLKLGGAQHFEGTFFLKKKGACSKHEKGTSLFIEKSWGGMCPQCPPPVPTSLSILQKGKSLCRYTNL